MSLELHLISVELSIRADSHQQNGQMMTCSVLIQGKKMGHDIGLHTDVIKA